jgi:hypothetical protein
MIYLGAFILALLLLKIILDELYNHKVILEKIDKKYIYLVIIFLETIIFFIIGFLNIYGKNLINTAVNSMIIFVVLTFVIYLFSCMQQRLESFLFSSLLNNILIAIATSLIVTMLLQRFFVI